MSIWPKRTKIFAANQLKINQINGRPSWTIFELRLDMKCIRIIPSGLQLTISGATSDSWLIRVISNGETESPEETRALPPAPTQVRVH